LQAVENPLSPLPSPKDNAAMEAKSPKVDAPKRKRRWYQFSLRTLLIVMLVVSIPCALLGRKIERKRREREVLDAINKIGGQVHYDYERWSWSLAGTQKKEPPGPGWLRALLGENFFCEVDEAHIVGVSSKTKITDADLSNLGLSSFPRLRSLTLKVNSLKITDAGLETIRDLTQIQELTLILPNVTDSGLRNLRGLTQLERLTLWGTRITNAGLVNLRGMMQLKTLDLSGVKVSDAGVKELQQALPNCKITR
jgi:hypothetical protein